MTSDPISRYLSLRTAKFDRRNRLRMMSSGEVIDTSVRIYQQLGWTLLKVTAVPALFCLAALAFVTQYVLPTLFVTENVGSRSAQFGEFSIGIGLALVVGGPLFLLGLSLTTAMVSQLVSDYMVGNVPSVDAARRTAQRIMFPLVKLQFWELVLSCGTMMAAFLLSFGSSLLDQTSADRNAVAAMVALLSVLAWIAGAFMFLMITSMHALSAPVAVLEGKPARQASRRSRELMKGKGIHPSGYGSVWSLYFVLFLVSLLMLWGMYGVFQIVGFPGVLEGFFQGLPGAALWLKALELFPLFLWVWTMVPVWAVAVTVIYYERRIRLEGYDIEALAADVWKSDRQTRFQL